MWLQLRTRWLNGELWVTRRRQRTRLGARINCDHFEWKCIAIHMHFGVLPQTFACSRSHGEKWKWNAIKTRRTTEMRGTQTNVINVIFLSRFCYILLRSPLYFTCRSRSGSECSGIVCTVCVVGRQWANEQNSIVTVFITVSRSLVAIRSLALTHRAADSPHIRLILNVESVIIYN